MENKYIVLANLNNETKKVLKKSYEKEKYELLVNEEGIIIAKKTNNNEVNIENEKLVIKVIQSMVKKYSGYGVLQIDLSKEINSILKNIEKDKNVRGTDNRITWPIRQAITKAIAGKSNI